MKKYIHVSILFLFFIYSNKIFADDFFEVHICTNVYYGQLGEVIPFTITLENLGIDEPSSVSLSDPLFGGALTNYIGDVNSDGILNLDEIWTFTASYTVTSDDVNNCGFSSIVTANGYDENGYLTQIATVTYHTFVNCNKTPPPGPPVYFYIETDVTTVQEAGDIINYTLTVHNDTNYVFPEYLVSGSLVIPTYYSGDINVNNEIDDWEVWIFKASYTVTQSDIDNNGGGDGDIDNVIDMEISNACDSFYSESFATSVVIEAMPVADIVIDDVSMMENTGNATFTVTLTGDVPGGFTVDYATSNGTAVAGSDYTTSSGMLVFSGSNGETQTFTVPILDDVIIEPTETFNATLSNLSTTLTQIVDGEGMGTIIDDDFDPTTGLYIDDVSVNEEDGFMTFSVNLVGNVSDSFTVDYTTDDNTAFQPGDYTATSGTLNFSGTDGEIHTFDVPIINDTVVEPAEYLYGLLTGETSTLIEIIDGSGDGEIISFDDPPNVSELYINDVTTIETIGMMAFTVTLLGVVQGGFTVDYNTFDITALDGSDYTASTGTLTFAGADQETQTFTVPILDDVIVEPIEDFAVILSNLSTTLAHIVDGEGVGTIIDDDNAGAEGFFSVTKVASVESVSMAGEVIDYQITITNLGYGAISDIEVNDPLVSDLSLTSGDSNGNSILDLSEIWNYSASYTVLQSDIDNFGIDVNGQADADGDIDNIVTVTGVDPFGVEETDEAEEFVLIDYTNNGSLFFSVQKDADVLEVDQVGDVITYTITVSNMASFAVDLDSDDDGEYDIYDENIDNLSYVSGDTNNNGLLDVDELWVFEGTLTITLEIFLEFGLDEYGNFDNDGNVENIAEVCGEAPNGGVECNLSNIVVVDLSIELYDDTDGDTVPNGVEDLNADGDLTNDDTDEDGIPNFLDPDDDGDGVLTINEDYNQDGDPTNDDVNSNGIPDYLDPEVTSSVGEENLSLFKIYPNPVGDILQIELKKNISQIILVIRNLQGQEVYIKELQPQTDRLNLDMTDFNAGVYFLHVKTNIGIQIQKIIVK